MRSAEGKKPVGRLHPVEASALKGVPAAPVLRVALFGRANQSQACRQCFRIL
jgi:hypothetical protein